MTAAGWFSVQLAVRAIRARKWVYHCVVCLADFCRKKMYFTSEPRLVMQLWPGPTNSF